MAFSKLAGDGAAPPRFAAVVNPVGRLADGDGVLGCSVGRGLDELGLTEREAVGVGAVVPGEADAVKVGAVALGEAAEEPLGAGGAPFPVQADSALATSIAPTSTILAGPISRSPSP
jgi:hypothetical protein